MQCCQAVPSSYHSTAEGPTVRADACLRISYSKHILCEHGSRSFAQATCFQLAVLTQQSDGAGAEALHTHSNLFRLAIILQTDCASMVTGYEKLSISAQQDCLPPHIKS